MTWYPWPASEIIARLDMISAKLDGLSQKLAAEEKRLMATLADVQAAVTAEKTVEGSVITLLQQLSDQLKAALAANDPAAVQAVVDQITANTKAMADAVAANTPAASGATGATGA